MIIPILHHYLFLSIEDQTAYIMYANLIVSSQYGISFIN